MLAKIQKLMKSQAGGGAALVGIVIISSLTALGAYIVSLFENDQTAISTPTP